MTIIRELKERIDRHDGKLWHKTVVLDRGDFLKLKGTVDTHVYYVKRGSLRTYIDQGAEEHTLRFGYPDTFVLALNSFFGGGPSELCIQAIKRSEVLVMQKSAFDGFMRASEENRRLWDQLVGRLVCEQVEREVDLLTTAPEERYARVLQRNPELFQEIPARYIASYLRMSAETLSRIKAHHHP